MEIDKNNGEVDPFRGEGTWYDTAEELVEGCAAEIERCKRRIEYLQSLIDEVVNRYD